MNKKAQLDLSSIKAFFIAIATIAVIGFLIIVVAVIMAG